MASDKICPERKKELACSVLANDFRLVPHEVLWAAFNFFPIAQDDHITTTCHILEMDIMAVSPLAFTMDMKLAMCASKWMLEGWKLKKSLQLPPIRSYMNGMMIITTSKPFFRQLHQKLQGNIKWGKWSSNLRNLKAFWSPKANWHMRGFILMMSWFQQSWKNLSRATSGGTM